MPGHVLQGQPHLEEPIALRRKGKRGGLEVWGVISVFPQAGEQNVRVWR